MRTKLGLGAMVTAMVMMVAAVADAQVRYGFETGTEGWRTNDAPNVKAVTNVARVSTFRQSGSYSLCVGLKLQGGVTNWDSGETYVDMLNNPAFGVPVPSDLLGKEISVYVFCPPGSQGNPSAPNGLQIFVKDTLFRSAYSTWSNISVGATGAWNRLTFTVPTNAGFNPRQIQVVGLKVGVGGGSTSVYAGPVYLDSVTFPSSASNFVAPADEKYGFATWIMGWKNGTNSSGQAVTNVVRVTSSTSNATPNLRINLKLVATNAPQRAGEASVVMLYDPPFGAQPPMNLLGQKITAKVYCPAGLRGVATNANGVQLYVKDAQYRAFYGTFTQIQEGYWMEVSVTPATNAPVNGYMQAGFTPTNIIEIGLQVSAPSNSTATYTGLMYLDGVGFTPVVPAIPSSYQQYSWEKDVEGFTSTNLVNNIAIPSCQRTTNKAALGIASLQLNVTLQGTNAAKNTGDTTVDMQWWPAPNVETPINLQGQEISVYVWSPAGARGTNAYPNGLQIFVKDDQWRAEYGTWTPIYEGVWQKVTLTPATTAPTNGFMAPGFNPARIRTLGLKLGCGTNARVANYTGPMYADVFRFVVATSTLTDLRYSFEPNKEGWGIETYPGITAVTSVVLSTSYKLDGTNSLAMCYSVRTSATQKAYGATWVDMLYYPPAVVRAPFNLTGQKVYANVYCPAGTQGGPVTNPSQLRLFVKDENFKAEYGPPVAIQDGEWVRVGMIPTTNPPPDWSMETNFNPAKIRVIGVDMGMVGTNAGRLYVDWVSFPAAAIPAPTGQSDHVYNFNATNALVNYPRWGADAAGWNAYAWTNVYLYNSSLAADAFFNTASSNDSARKGVFALSYNPPLNLSTKNHRIIQAKLKFEPPVEGLMCFTATIAVYDKITDQWYTHAGPVGGSDWNILQFNLDNVSDYASGSPVPMNSTQIGAITIQIFGDPGCSSYTGKVLLDDVIVGGDEVAGAYTPIQGGFVQQEPDTKDAYADKGQLFWLDGKPFYFGGANIEYLATVYDSTCEELLDAASNMHIRVVRTWAFHEGKDYSFQPERGVWNESCLEHMDRIIAMAGKRNMRLLLGLVDNWGHNGGMFQYMAWVLNEHPESLPPNLRTNAAIGTIPLHDEFYTNTWAKQWYKDYVTMLLNRTNTISGLKYKDDPVIFGWEIINEPRCETDNTNRPYGRLIHNWIKEMSDYVRTLDTNHLLAAGEEGGYITTYTNADAAAYQDFAPPEHRNYWLYSLWGGGSYADFISDYKSSDTLVEWQYGTPTNHGAVTNELRSGVPNVGFCPFRMYIDLKEYNLWRTNYNGYDQREEWILDHGYDSHAIINKPTILEEFGIHSVGWTYGGFYGEYQFERYPEYTWQDRTNLYKKIYSLVEDNGLNGTFFWNLGYKGMWEDPFDTCEQVGNWYADTSSDATGVSVSTNYVRQGAGSLQLSYNGALGRGKALWTIPTNQQWLVRMSNGVPTGVNRVKFPWMIYKPAGSALNVAVALTATTNYNWYESTQQTLTNGWNEIIFDLSAGDWKAADTGWQPNRHLLDVLDSVKKVNLVVYGETNAGSIYIDNVRVKRDDGFIIYAGDPLEPVIRQHADNMAAKGSGGPVRYNWESSAEGWSASWEAVTQTVWSTAFAYNGTGSLRVNVGLQGNNASKDEGECQVDTANNPPAGLSAGPYHMDGDTLKAYVYCPAGSGGGGGATNSLRLFVKDGNWVVQYGPSKKIVEGAWNEVSLTITWNGLLDTYTSPNFDPRWVRAIGLKIGAGSTNSVYNGPLYLDAYKFEQ